MAAAELAELLEAGEADGGGGGFGGEGRVEGDVAEGVPEVFAEGWRDGLFTVEGELAEGEVVLLMARVS